MAVPFLVPAGMMAVKVAGKWLLKKLAKRTRKKVLSKETNEKLKKKAEKIGRKNAKKEGTPPFAKEASKEARKGPINPALTEGLKAGKDLKREKDFLKGVEDRIAKNISQRKPGQPGEGKPRSKRRKDVTAFDRRSIKVTDKAMKKAAEEVGKNAKEAKEALKKRKRTRELEEDAKRRRN
jgi:hypothetical protein